MAFLYYSTQSTLADRISERYYNEYFVFCSTDFYSSNPGSSSPAKIYRTFREIAEEGDRRQTKFEDHKVKLKGVAEMKFQQGDISSDEHAAITYEIANCETRDFAPILYLILRSSVQDKRRSVPVDQRASSASVEFIIEKMTTDEFERLISELRLSGPLS